MFRPFPISHEQSCDGHQSDHSKQRAVDLRPLEYGRAERQLHSWMQCLLEEKERPGKHRSVQNETQCRSGYKSSQCGSKCNSQQLQIRRIRWEIADTCQETDLVGPIARKYNAPQPEQGTKHKHERGRNKQELGRRRFRPPGTPSAQSRENGRKKSAGFVNLQCGDRQDQDEYVIKPFASTSTHQNNEAEPEQAEIDIHLSDKQK